MTFRQKESTTLYHEFTKVSMEAGNCLKTSFCTSMKNEDFMNQDKTPLSVP